MATLQRQPARRTPLGLSPEIQDLLRIIVAFGLDGPKIAQILITVNFDYEKASKILGTQAPTLRQRVHRGQLRVRAILGEKFYVPIRRTAVSYGAERKGVYRMFGADTTDPSDLAAQREEGELAAHG